MNNTMFFYVILFSFSSIIIAGDKNGNNNKQSLMDYHHELGVYNKFKVMVTYPEASVMKKGKLLHLRHTADLNAIKNGKYNNYEIENHHIISNISIEEDKDDDSVTFKSIKKQFDMRFDRNNKSLLFKKIWRLMDANSIVDDEVLASSSFELHFIDPKYKYAKDAKVKDWYTLQFSADQYEFFKNLKKQCIEELEKQRYREEEKKNAAQNQKMHDESLRRIKYEKRCTFVTRCYYFIGCIISFLAYFKFR